MLSCVEWDGFTARVENGRGGREENVWCALDEHPRLSACGGGGFIIFRFKSVVLDNAHHPLVPRVERNLKYLLIVVRKKWQHVSGAVERKTFMEGLFCESKDGCVGWISFDGSFVNGSFGVSFEFGAVAETRGECELGERRGLSEGD